MSKEFQTSGAKFNVVHCPHLCVTKDIWMSAYIYYYRQTWPYRHPLNMNTSLFTDSLLCPWGKKSLAFSLNSVSVLTARV